MSLLIRFECRANWEDSFVLARPPSSARWGTAKNSKVFEQLENRYSTFIEALDPLYLPLLTFVVNECLRWNTGILYLLELAQNTFFVLSSRI